MKQPKQSLDTAWSIKLAKLSAIRFLVKSLQINKVILKQYANRSK